MASGPLVVKLEIKADGTAAIVGLNKVHGALDTTGEKGKRASSGINALSTSLQSLAMTAGAALSVGALARSFITANIESQRLVKGLTAVAGSATAGAAEMDYISKTADRLGLSLTTTGSAYVGLTAATKGTALEGQATRDIFESVSLAMGKLGKSSADTQGALLALQQMVSKGTVSAEELRGQLGERLPGAFRLAAEALGQTEAELGKMLESGSILATDLLPALSQKLNNLYNDGKAVGGLEASWNILNNALDRMLVSADNAAGATRWLGDVLLWATGKANAFAEALQVIDNWRQGKGFAYGERDAIASDWALRAKLVDEYVAKMKQAQAYADADGVDKNFPRRAGQEADALIARINEIDARIDTTRADLKVARAEADNLAQRQAGSMNDDAVRIFREQQAAIEENRKSIDGMMGQYDKAIVKKAEYAKMEALLTEAVKLGTLTETERTAKLAAFAAAQDKATASSHSRAKALSAEAQAVAAVEAKYGLYKGQLDAVWKLESNRGKGAGTDSARWVKDLAAGGGHMTKIVGQFQMAENTAKGLGANMKTFNGQADAAGKYLAQAAAQGKTLWEQFAYYHGGPNEKSWGEKTRAYADAAVKIVADATGTMQDLGQNTGQVITDSLNRSQSAVESLIQRYLPARAAAEAYAQAQIDLATASDLVGLSQEEQSIILQGLKRDLDESAKTADAWTEVWKNAVKRIDDTFANLWEDLFSGGKSALASLKKAITSWLAEVAHALLTKPLVVAITASMTGGAVTAGAAGTVGNAVSNASGFGSLGNIASGLSSLFNWGGSALSSIFSGAVFSGISSGFGMAMSNIGAAGYFGAFTSNMALASSSFSSGAIGTAIGAAAPYLLAAIPIAAIAYGIFAKYQKDQEPRYGAYAATTHGGVGQFEDSVGVRGAFGLTFGMNDKGSANIDANEARSVFEGFAKMSEAMAQFYGVEVSTQVEAALKKISEEHYAKTGILNYAMDANQAFDVAFTQIINAAAATGDSVAVVMKAVVGDLSGTAQAMAGQIEAAMNTTAAVIQVAKALEGTDTGKLLELGTDLTANALRLVDYANAIKWTGETTAAALGRMGQYITVLNTALDLSGNTVDLTGQAFIDLARNLAYAADVAKIGIEGLAQLQAFYFDQFTSAEAKFTRNIEAASKAITDSFKELNIFPTKDIKLGGVADPLIVKDRQAFMDLINGLDLTTESGRKLYVELMKLTPAFDAIFDGVESFMGWLNAPNQVQAAIDSLTGVFGGWGLSLPKTREDLEKLVASGGLTTEQMAILGGYLDALRLVFDDLGSAVDDVTGKYAAQRQSLLDLANQLDPQDPISPAQREKADAALRAAGYTGDIGDAQGIAAFLRALALMDDAGGAAGQDLLAFIETFEMVFDAIAAAAEQNASLQQRLAAARGDDALVLRLQREQELKGALDATNRALLEEIYRLEDAKTAMEQAYAAIEKAVADERQHIDKAYQARVDAINKEREAINQQMSDAQESLSKVAGIVNSIQSALEQFRNTVKDNDIALAAARRQLASWASQGVLPDQEDFDRVMGTLNRDDKGNYASANAYRANQQATYANLLELERLGLAQKTDAEKQLEALEAQLDTLDRQLQAANDWRDAELARLDALLVDAKDRMEIAIGTRQTLISLDEAMRLLAASITAYPSPAANDPDPPLYGDTATQGAIGTPTDTSLDDLRAEIIELRNTIASVGTAQITPLKSIDDRLRKFDTDGLPPGRDDVVLLRAA